ncbi:MAG TPA: winged helix-turn-helix domain-containing protein [Thermoanaerobaculia bacterium]|nr:winged helix-turn-helix domain-containing protein [Thermoanaerobaculia bacterium]
MGILDASVAAATALRFGDFELRLDSGELLRGGVQVKLQLQPARVLAVLALRAGEVVSREEIRNAVWGEESHVDFDLALNYSIRQIRLALDDSAEQPRFVATLPRVGYRFLAPVESRREADSSPPEAPEPSRQRARSVVKGFRGSWRLILAAALALVSLVSLIALRSRGNGGRDLPSQEAMSAYLEGRYLEITDPEKAPNAFHKATMLAPDFAPAWAALAHALLEEQRPAREVMPLVETAEKKALQLNPKLPLAHLDRAMRLVQYEYDWHEAEQEFRRALALDPQRPDTHFEYAMLLAVRGRHAEALDQVEQAQYLQPARPIGQLPWFYYLARRYDEAIEKAQHQIGLLTAKTSEGNPTQHDLFWAFRTMTLASLAKGDQEAALGAARAEEHWLGEKEPESLEDFWSAKEERFAKVGPYCPSYAVVPAVELGQRERALDLLLQICHEKSDPLVAFVRVDPLYDSLRSHPRYQELLRCVKLTDEPKKSS